MGYAIVTNEKEKAPVLSSITKILFEIGISPSLKGYRLLRNAVYLYTIDEERFCKPKELYEMLENMHNESVSSIESNMRHCVRQALNSGKLLELNRIMGIDVINDNSPLSNLQFVTFVAEAVRYETNDNAPFLIDEFSVRI